jgi:hypothetical protein
MNSARFSNQLAQIDVDDCVKLSLMAELLFSGTARPLFFKTSPDAA